MYAEPPLARPGTDVLAFARALAQATSMQLVEIERRGLPATFVKRLARRLGVPVERLTGRGIYTAIAVTRLLGMVDALLARSGTPEAQGFDVARWLGSWIERPIPALAGYKPADLLDTPTGFELVSHVLAAAESGAFC